MVDSEITGSDDAEFERQAAIYNQSLDRCIAHPGFLDRFYELFLNSSDEVREKFKNTDFTRQKKALEDSLFIMTSAHQWSVGCDSHMEEIAHRHSRDGRDIRPELYDLWLDCLIRSVREHDPQFDDQIEAAWRNVLKKGIAYMKSRY